LKTSFPNKIKSLVIREYPPPGRKTTGIVVIDGWSARDHGFCFATAPRTEKSETKRRLTLTPRTRSQLGPDAKVGRDRDRADLREPTAAAIGAMRNARCCGGDGVRPLTRVTTGYAHHVVVIVRAAAVDSFGLSLASK
jgi:hypothetical protein